MLTLRHNMFAISFVWFCIVFSTHTWAEAETRTYIVGIVPQFDIREIKAIWQPIIADLTERTGYNFELQGSPSIPVFEQEFSRGKFDFAYMNPYHLIMANQAQGYIPIAKDHSRLLQGILVARKNSSIQRIGELDGKELAFPSPNALGASLLMRAELNDKFKIKVKPRYVKTHDSVYLNVVLGLTAAGGGVSRTLDKQAEEISSQLRIIYKTQSVAPHPISVHPRLTKAVQKNIYDALWSMAQSEQGKLKLAKIPIRQLGPAQLADYNPLKKMKLERFYAAK